MLLCSSSPLQDEVMLNTSLLYLFSRSFRHVTFLFVSLLTRGSRSCRVNFLKSNSMEKILSLTHRRERFLVVAAVRFMRTVIGTNVSVLCPINKLSAAWLRVLLLPGETTI
jgi:hypothetical protein